MSVDPAGDAHDLVEASDTPAPAPDRVIDPARPVAPTASPAPTDPTTADSPAAPADAETATAETTAAGSLAVPSAATPSATADAPIGRRPGEAVPAAVARPAASVGLDGEDERPIPGLALIGVVLGLWAVAPAYTGPGLILQDPSVELIDHVLPGLGVIGVSVVAIVVTRSSPRPGAVLFTAGAAVTTAGLWMVATHVPLLLQAVQGEAPWGAVLFHLAPSAAVLWLGLAWTVRYWTDWVAPPG